MGCARRRPSRSAADPLIRDPRLGWGPRAVGACGGISSRTAMILQPRACCPDPTLAIKRMPWTIRSSAFWDPMPTQIPCLPGFHTFPDPTPSWMPCRQVARPAPGGVPYAWTLQARRHRLRLLQGRIRDPIRDPIWDPIRDPSACPRPPAAACPILLLTALGIPLLATGLWPARGAHKDVRSRDHRGPLKVWHLCQRRPGGEGLHSSARPWRHPLTPGPCPPRRDPLHPPDLAAGSRAIGWVVARRRPRARCGSRWGHRLRLAWPSSWHGEAWLGHIRRRLQQRRQLRLAYRAGRRAERRAGRRCGCGPAPPARRAEENRACRRVRRRRLRLWRWLRLRLRGP